MTTLSWRDKLRKIERQQNGTSSASKALLERRSEVAKRMVELANTVNREKRDFDPDERTAWHNFDVLYEELSAKIEEQEGRYGMDDRIGREDVDHRDSCTRGEHGRGSGNDGASLLDDALAAWVKTQSGEGVSEQQYQRCVQFGISPNSGSFTIPFERTRPVLGRNWFGRHTEKRALGTVTDNLGGYTVGPLFKSTLELAMMNVSGMLQASEIMDTLTGAPMAWPTCDDTSIEGELIGEGATVDEEDVSFGQHIFYSYKISSRLVKVNAELIQDSAIQIANTLATILGERIGRKVNSLCTTGDGASKPTGIVNSATVGVTAASQTAFTGDELIQLQHSVDSSYRSSPGCAWMMNDAVASVVRRMKDGDGQYLWRQGLESGQPNMLLGNPVIINSSMTGTVSTGADVILYGDLSKYKIRFSGPMRMRRLVERYAESDQEGFIAFRRVDGGLLNAGTHPVKKLRMA